MPAFRRCCSAPKMEKQEFPKVVPTKAPPTPKKKKKFKKIQKFLIENLSHVRQKRGGCQRLGRGTQGAHTQTHAAGARSEAWHFTKLPSRSFGFSLRLLKKKTKKHSPASKQK